MVIAMASSSVESRGAVFTRPQVVDFMLDLAGYTTDRPLYQWRILEPCFGTGAFVFPILRRLLASWRSTGSEVSSLSRAVRVIELDRDSFEATRTSVLKFLSDQGVVQDVAKALVDAWLCQGDFLSMPIAGEFDFVIGNPPYVRQERLSTTQIAEYRRRYRTIYDRADLYIPFFERSLSLLSDRGKLGFICANRWMKNRYGQPLRKFIAADFHLETYVNIDGVQAFDVEVDAYPAITIIGRQSSGSRATRVAQCADLERATLANLAQTLQAKTLPKQLTWISERDNITSGSDPWLFDATERIALVRRIEAQFPTLESAACKVGIGVATGADKHFIGDYDALDVEVDRKLPLVMTQDIASGEIRWRGQGVINPFAEKRGLVNLAEYPKLKRYLEERREAIANRHCARKNPANWYRTIDRIKPELARCPKLLIPDIKGRAHVVYENGKLYPHHNLYYVTSECWELRALQAVLQSAIAHLFIETFSTKMRGGYLRFQAQYLRRICIPAWENVSADLRQELREAAITANFVRGDRAVFKLYQLSNLEHTVLRK